MKWFRENGVEVFVLLAWVSFMLLFCSFCVFCILGILAALTG